MKQQIIVRNENNEKIGETYFRRAKQLVNKQKAVWLDEAHTEIGMVRLEHGLIEINQDIVDFINKVFEDVEDHGNKDDLKTLAMTNLKAKCETLMAGGIEESDAVAMAISEIGSDKPLDKLLERKKSRMKDAYRDDVGVVLRSSPIEIIKKSRKRTRELHIAFSAVLWSGAAIVYLALNFLLGNTRVTLRVSELSGTWLVFVVAALMECLVEIYFSRKELEVLNENIDLRQVNPSKTSDFDLWGYQKELSRKIRIMSSAVLWIPLIMAYFIAGYSFGLWGSAWIVFLLGAFCEFLLNLVKKLQQQSC